MMNTIFIIFYIIGVFVSGIYVGMLWHNNKSTKPRSKIKILAKVTAQDMFKHKEDIIQSLIGHSMHNYSKGKLFEVSIKSENQ